MALPVVDLSGFPILRVRVPEPGDPARMHHFLAGLDAALKRDAAFAVLYVELPENDEETLEERQLISGWLKREKGRLAQHCRGFVYAAMRPAQNAELDRELGKFRGKPDFPYPFTVCATAAEAEQVAAGLVAS